MQRFSKVQNLPENSWNWEAYVQCCSVVRWLQVQFEVKLVNDHLMSRMTRQFLYRSRDLQRCTSTSRRLRTELRGKGLAEYGAMACPFNDHLYSKPRFIFDFLSGTSACLVCTRVGQSTLSSILLSAITSSNSLDKYWPMFIILSLSHCPRNLQ